MRARSIPRTVAKRAVAARAREARGADVVCPRHADGRGGEADGLDRADAAQLEAVRAPDHVEGRVVGPRLGDNSLMNVMVAAASGDAFQRIVRRLLKKNCTAQIYTAVQVHTHICFKYHSDIY